MEAYVLHKIQRGYVDGEHIDGTCCSAREETLVNVGPAYVRTSTGLTQRKEIPVTALIDAK